MNACVTQIQVQIIRLKHLFSLNTNFRIRCENHRGMFFVSAGNTTQVFLPRGCPLQIFTTCNVILLKKTRGNKHILWDNVILKNHSEITAVFFEAANNSTSFYLGSFWQMHRLLSEYVWLLRGNLSRQCHQQRGLCVILLREITLTFKMAATSSFV